MMKIKLSKESEYKFILPPNLCDRLPLDNIVIDSFKQEFNEAIQHFKRQDVIGLSLEGSTISRSGVLEWLCISTSSCTFLFDIQSLGKDAFSNGLKIILENGRIIKVLHDCRRACDCLFHQYNVKLSTVYDTQVAEFVANAQKNKTEDITNKVNSLDYCLTTYLNLPREFLYSQLNDITCYSLRPIEHLFRNILIKNVIYLRQLKQELDLILRVPFRRCVDVYLQSIQIMSDQKLKLHPPKLETIPPEMAIENMQLFTLSETLAKRNAGLDLTDGEVDHYYRYERNCRKYQTEGHEVTANEAQQGDLSSYYERHEIIQFLMDKMFAASSLKNGSSETTIKSFENLSEFDSCSLHSKDFNNDKSSFYENSIYEKSNFTSSSSASFYKNGESGKSTPKVQSLKHEDSDSQTSYQNELTASQKKCLFDKYKMLALYNDYIKEKGPLSKNLNESYNCSQLKVNGVSDSSLKVPPASVSFPKTANSSQKELSGIQKPSNSCFSNGDSSAKQDNIKKGTPSGLSSKLKQLLEMQKNSINITEEPVTNVIVSKPSSANILKNHSSPSSSSSNNTIVSDSSSPSSVVSKYRMLQIQKKIKNEASKNPSVPTDSLSPNVKDVLSSVNVTASSNKPALSFSVNKQSFSSDTRPKAYHLSHESNRSSSSNSDRSSLYNKPVEHKTFSIEEKPPKRVQELDNWSSSSDISDDMSFTSGTKNLPNALKQDRLQANANIEEDPWVGLRNAFSEVGPSTDSKKIVFVPAGMQY